MTLSEYLAAEGLSPEEIAAVVGNEKQAKAMAKALGLADEGRAALTKAQSERQETEQFWEQKTKDLEGSVARLTAAEKKAATAEADRARYHAYLTSLKEQGYDVPDALLAANAPGTKETVRDPGTGQYVTQDEFKKGVRGVAPDLVSLTKLSNEYSYLKGEPYLAVDEDFAEAQKAGKSLTEYARAKYKFDDLHAQKKQAAGEAAYQERFKKDIEAERAKWAKENGSNSNTAAPVASKFDRLTSREGFKSDSWKSQQGREENRNARLDRFKNFDFRKSSSPTPVQ